MSRETVDYLRQVGVGESWLEVAMTGVNLAMVEAIDKHGKPTSDPVRGGCTLGEEAGEVMAYALDATRPSFGGVVDHKQVRLMIKELEQAAAYAILLVTSMTQLARELERGAER